MNLNDSRHNIGTVELCVTKSRARDLHRHFTPEADYSRFWLLSTKPTADD